MQDPRAGEFDGPDDAGGEEGVVVALRGEIGREGEEVREVQDVRRELHGDRRVVVGEREQRGGGGRGEIDEEPTAASAGR